MRTGKQQSIRGPGVGPAGSLAEAGSSPHLVRLTTQHSPARRHDSSCVQTQMREFMQHHFEHHGAAHAMPHQAEALHK